MLRRRDKSGSKAGRVYRGRRLLRVPPGPSAARQRAIQEQQARREEDAATRALEQSDLVAWEQLPVEERRRRVAAYRASKPGADFVPERWIVRVCARQYVQSRQEG